ncbi:MAG: ribosome maturation factor RimM [Marinoscillum sp.]
MGFDECYQLGNVVKTHGLKGEIVISLDVDHPESYQEMESVLVDVNGKLVPFFIESLHMQGDRAITALEDIESIDEAKTLVGKDLYLPLKFLPKLPEGQYYYHELIGFDFYDQDKYLGKVKEVYEMPTNHLLNVDYNGTEVLVPAEDAILNSVNLAEQKIIATLPEGLLEVYLDQKKS